MFVVPNANPPQKSESNELMISIPYSNLVYEPINFMKDLYGDVEEMSLEEKDEYFMKLGILTHFSKKLSILYTQINLSI